MSLNTVEKYVEDLFRSYWDTKPCDWPNKAYNPEASQKNIVWARFRFYPFDERPSLVGGLKKTSTTTIGRIVIDIYVPLGKGTVQLGEIQDELKALFYKQAIRPCNLFFRRIRALRVGPYGAFYQGSVELDFEFSEVR